MATINEGSLSALLKNDTCLKLVESHIYSVCQDLENSNSYDRRFGNIYDWVACNRFYNRLVWGYSISDFAVSTHEALRSSKDGFVLDAGCGSLAFTAGTYSTYLDRPVIFLDQSLKLLRIAKSRLTKMHGSIPPNMLFLHGDALRLPFKPRSFKTIISLNLLHVLDDVATALNGLKHVLTEDGSITLTSLVRSNRIADRYLKAWENAGEVIARDIAEIKAVFDQLGMPMRCKISGNMAFIHYDGMLEL